MARAFSTKGELVEGICSLILAVAIIAAATGCSSDGDAADGGTGGEAVVAWEDLPVMGRAYRLPLEEAMRRQRAAGIEAAQAEVDCVVGKGFTDYSIDISPPDTSALLVLARARNEEEARTRGLRVADFLVENNTGELVTLGDPAAPEATANDPDRERALEEAATECRAQAERPGSARDRVATLIDSYRFDVLDQPEMRAAFDAWQACMADRGYDVRSVQELVTSIRQSLPPPDISGPSTREEAEALVAELRPKEEDAALAQVACDGRALAPVLPRWVELETSWQSNNALTLDEVPPEWLDLWPTAMNL